MLKREDMETLRWQVGDDGEAFWAEGFKSQTKEGATLQSAAPKLALACLRALEIWGNPEVVVCSDADRAVGNALQQIFEGVPAELRAALTAAGIEVP